MSAENRKIKHVLETYSYLISAQNRVGGPVKQENKKCWPEG